MKYKIIKCENKTLQTFLSVDENGKSYNEIKVIHSVWYEAKRKGKYFGFWHIIGHNHYFDGEVIAFTSKTVKEMEDYIHKWHEVHYFKQPIEIIKCIDL
jgi:hypothetical protein